MAIPQYDAPAVRIDRVTVTHVDGGFRVAFGEANGPNEDDVLMRNAVFMGPDLFKRFIDLAARIQAGAYPTDPEGPHALQS